jgi:diguanylate cyclase (GGDEF)-like protein
MRVCLWPALACSWALVLLPIALGYGGRDALWLPALTRIGEIAIADALGLMLLMPLATLPRMLGGLWRSYAPLQLLLLGVPLWLSLFVRPSWLLLCLPQGLLIASRNGMAGAALGLLTVVIGVLAGTTHRLGLFAAGDIGAYVDMVLFTMALAISWYYAALTQQELARHQDVLETEVLHRTEALEAANRQLTLLATTDALTGLINRREWMRLFEEAMARAARTADPLAILMLDIDHFKLINDRFGHPVGDAVLQAFAARCGSVLRAYDKLGRIGGEEFAVLLPGGNLEEALRVAEKLRAVLAATPLTLEDGQLVRLTCSVGVASAGRELSAERLLASADEALYRAKRDGRDRVAVA